MGRFLHFNHDKAGVVKLVDAEDSKSSDPCGRVGSIPTSGTRKINGLAILLAGPFFLKFPIVPEIVPIEPTSCTT
jgi:hypothetical protein